MKNIILSVLCALIVCVLPLEAIAADSQPGTIYSPENAEEDVGEKETGVSTAPLILIGGALIVLVRTWSVGRKYKHKYLHRTRYKTKSYVRKVSDTEYEMENRNIPDTDSDKF